MATSRAARRSPIAGRLYRRTGSSSMALSLPWGQVVEAADRFREAVDRGHVGVGEGHAGEGRGAHHRFAGLFVLFDVFGRLDQVAEEQGDRLFGQRVRHAVGGQAGGALEGVGQGVGAGEGDQLGRQALQQVGVDQGDRGGPGLR